MNFWHLTNINWTGVRLWRMDDNNFRITDRGLLEPVLENWTYILINKKYRSAFEDLINQVTIHEVCIHDVLHKTENHDYIELKIKNSLNPRNPDENDQSGYKIWNTGGLFVSTDLKNRIISISAEGIAFTPGFSGFGG
jgi:hypothetical protein